MSVSRIRWVVLVVAALVLAIGATYVRSWNARGFEIFADAYVWSPDGVERVSPGDGIYYQPCIRSDGKAVVFAGAPEGPPRIWCVDLESGERRALTPADSAALHPTYSWDGARIAFTSDRASGAPPLLVTDLQKSGRPRGAPLFHLFVMDADGENVRQLTSGKQGDWRPSFSPDGKRLVYQASRRTWQLWTVAVDGSGEPERVKGAQWGSRPWFSADSRTIFFHTVRGRSPDRAHRVPAEGGQMIQLENDIFEKTHGSFADPDGKSLLVHARLDGLWGIWELPLDGGEPQQLKPPGFTQAYHPTRSLNGIVAFDLPRPSRSWREVLRRLGL